MVLNEYQVIGRRTPSEKEPEPKLYRMRLFAPNEVVAKSRFWYFVKQQKNVKKATGQIVSVTRISEPHPEVLKNFAIWVRYHSRSGIHNMYKEYRDTRRVGAVRQLYKEMASRHRARWSSIHIIRVDTIANSAVRRANTLQYLGGKVRFPLPHRVVRVAKPYRKTFSAVRPNTHFS